MPLITTVPLSRRVGLWLLVVISFACLPFAGCAKKDSASGKPVIVVSILPQRYFVERIGGDRVTPLVLVGPGQSPHSYEPTPQQMLAIARAKSWVLSGTEFEIALKPKIVAQCPSLAIVDGTEGVTFRLLQEGEHEDHHDEEGAGHDDEEEGHEGEETNIDRHFWLGKEPSKVLAAHIRDALSAADPSGSEIYEANYAALIGDIETTFGELAAKLAPLSGRTVLVFHPAFGYFLDEFGLRQESVETGGKEPTPKALSELVAKAKAEHTPAIFVQAQFPVAAAKNVADSVGAAVIPLDPLAPDWLANIARMGDALAQGLARE